MRFAPLPVQGVNVPIWFGGRDEKALRRAGRLGQGYHSSATGHDQLAVRIPIINAAATEAGRPAPLISARVRVQFGPSEAPFYMLAGTPEQMVTEIRAFQTVGAGHMAFDFAETDPDECVRLMERFDREVLAAFR